MSRFETEKSLVLDTGLKLAQRGLIVGKAGNVSQRLKQGSGPDLIVITPTSQYYDTLAATDIPVIDFEGNIIEGRMAPSSEMKLHLAIYRARADVGAIVHTHSIHASALAVAGLGIPAILEEEVAILGGEIRLAKYGKAGSEELALNAVEAMGDSRAVILSNHGAVGVGKSLREALDAAELIERAARVYILALSTGKINALSPEGIAKARATYLGL